MKDNLITIDGPAGAGKTTVSRELARRLGYTYVDTGALYRGVAWAVRTAGCAGGDDERIGAVCRSVSMYFTDTPRGLRFFVNGEDVSDAIRTQEITMLASALSARAVVRDALLGVQRRLGAEGNAIFEGRDMGTVVFPEARFKFYLDADPEIRVLRRYKELLEKGEDIRLETVRQNMQKRDQDDSSRALAPLKPAPDAVRIDSTAMSLDQVIVVILEHISKRRK
ncbi:MAG: (d)CMP kinase [Deltaproteobacteria bacterium]|nr:(d)CMP kinase [Deltaproteobacteria bacterium]